MMDIKAFLQCKKPRRSNRLEVKERQEYKEKTIKLGPLGFFDTLPIELKFSIFKYLTVEDLSLLTITSKSMRNLIEGFCATQPILKRDIIDKLHVKTSHLTLPVEKQSDLIGIFKRFDNPTQLDPIIEVVKNCLLTFIKILLKEISEVIAGLLMKRSTCLYATRDRLRFINEILTKLMCCNYPKYTCENLSKCVSLTCFGKFFHTVIAGWDDSECVRAYEAICHHSSVIKNVKLIMSAKAGGHGQVEYEVRTFLRRVFLDQCQSVQDRAFWLSRVLKPWPIVHQARLLFLLYGPLLNDEPMWFDLCENTPSNSEQSAAQFGELSSAVQILHHYQQEWSEDDIVSVVDELTSFPDEWLAENVAHLLILCGDAITSKLLISKAINGRMMELSSIFTSFCVVCVKNNFSTNYVVKMMQTVVSSIDNCKDRQLFFSSIMDMFRELIIDIHEFGEPDEDNGNDMYYIVTSLIEFTKRVLHIAFKDLVT